MCQHQKYIEVFGCKFTPMEFETGYSLRTAQGRQMCKFTPMEFETRMYNNSIVQGGACKFTPMEFETGKGKYR